MSGQTSKGSGRGRVVALCGGVGGAKLALGLARQVGSDLTLVVNTGDDLEHLGLAISPDLDTVLYTLGGIANKELGWGRADESWNFMQALGHLGGEAWFQLGDRDLALHVERTHHLRAGRSLTDFMAQAARAHGIEATLLPMSDDPIRTTLATSEGQLPFQRYFVERRCAPEVFGIAFVRRRWSPPRSPIRISAPSSSARPIPSSASIRSSPRLASARCWNRRAPRSSPSRRSSAARQ